MYELLYTSIATKELTDLELKRILKKARVKNERLGITVMLIHHEREFFQILEGEEKMVKALFRTIHSDPAHTSVEVFYEGPVEKRAFTGWSMAFKSLEKEDLSRLLPGYEETLPGSQPQNFVFDNSNLGKRLFFKLREQLGVS